MPTRSIQFSGAQGDRLSARLELPIAGQPIGFVLFAHCFTCSKDLRSVVTISRSLADRGFGVLRFDFTGLGQSEGDFADTNFSSNVEDLVAAGRHLAEHFEAPEILIGHSLGGAAVLQATSRFPSVRAVCTIGAPADPGHVLQLVAEHAAEIEAAGEATVSLAGREFKIKKQFLDDLEAQSMERTVRELDAALLIFHSPVDQIVGIENAARLYGMARHPKSFVSLDDADHLLTKEADSAYVAAVIQAWASRYVGGSRGVAEALDEGDVRVTTGRDGFTTGILARDHRLLADEPADLGGRDRGPTPYELLLSALGACKGITLKMYANRKGWSLDEVEVRLRHRRVHAKDMAECDECDHRVDRVDANLVLTGDLSGEQRERLREIADRCPVHRTLDGGVRIETALTEG